MSSKQQRRRTRHSIFKEYRMTIKERQEKDEQLLKYALRGLVVACITTIIVAALPKVHIFLYPHLMRTAGKAIAFSVF